MGTGRPTEYTEELAERILSDMMDGKSLREICRQDGIPARSTIHLWVAKGEAGDEVYKSFSDRYVTAAEVRAFELFDELLEIADDGSNDWMERNTADGATLVTNTEAIQRSRLRVDARKWALSKMIPKTFGDKIQQELTGKDGSPIAISVNQDDAEL